MATSYDEDIDDLGLGKASVPNLGPALISEIYI